MTDLGRRSFLFLPIGLVLANSAVAQTVDKFELVMFDRVGCPWCAKWDAEVGPAYNKTWEGQRAPLRRLSMHPPYPSDLSFIKNIIYSPTFVLVRGRAEIGRIVGYPGEAFFYVKLSQLLEKAGS